jgi:hypothetical protein
MQKQPALAGVKLPLACISCFCFFQADFCRSLLQGFVDLAGCRERGGADDGAAPTVGRMHLKICLQFFVAEPPVVAIVLGKTLCGGLLICSGGYDNPVADKLVVGPVRRYRNTVVVRDL